MPRGRSRSRSRSRSPKRPPRRRRSRSRSSSGGSPRYDRKRKPSSHARRYSRGSRSPMPRRSTPNQNRKPVRRSMSSSPERGGPKYRSPKRSYSRSRSASPKPGRPTSKPKVGPVGPLDSAVLGNSQLSEFEMRIRELQSGSSGKVSTFDDAPSRQVKIPKEEPAVGNYGPLQPGGQIGSTGNKDQSLSQQGYQANGAKDKRSASQRSRSPSPRRRREKSKSPPVKHRKKSYTPPRRKSKYRSESPSPRKRSKESKKSRRAAAAEHEAKKSPPRSSRRGPGIESHLIVIPRRKDEGSTPIFDRPEIPIYTIRDDPSLIAEGYFDKEDSQRARGSLTQASYTQQPREGPRAPSPTVTFSSTGLDKFSFPNSAAFFDQRKRQPAQAPRLPLPPPPTQIVSTTLGEIHDRMRNSGLQVDRLPNTDLRLALDRKQLSPLRGAPFASDLLSRETMLYEREKMNNNNQQRSLSEERRPVKERLGGKNDDRMLPDFRKEVDMLNQSDPLSVPKSGNYYEHDNREGDHGRPPYTSPTRRPFRGRYSGYRGNNYIRGFRGRFSRGSFSRGSYGPPSRGYQGYQHKERDRWTHDKFEDDRKNSKKDKHNEDHGDDKGSKKDKKPKKPDRERRSSHHKS